MGQSVDVVVSELHSASTRLRDAGQRLQDGLSSVDLETSQLLGTGWKSDAGSAFGNAWEQWHSGAGQVVRGLQTMADLLNVAGKEYAKTDVQAAGAVASSFDGGGTGGPVAAGAPSPGPGPVGAPGNGGPQAGRADAATQFAQQMMPSASQGGETAAGLPGQLAQSLAQLGQAIVGLVEQAAQRAGDAATDVEDDSDAKGEKDKPGEEASTEHPSTLTAPLETSPADASQGGPRSTPSV